MAVPMMQKGVDMNERRPVMPWKRERQPALQTRSTYSEVNQMSIQPSCTPPHGTPYITAQLYSTLIQVSSRAEARGRRGAQAHGTSQMESRWVGRDGWGWRNGTGRGATARGGTCAAPTERTLSARKAVQPADLCAAARITRVYSTVE